MESLFEQLTKLHKKQLEDLMNEREAPEKEKEAMNTLSSQTNPSEIIEINAGGEIITAHRDTLTLIPGSMLAGMFSGRWEDKVARDDAGRVFLDHDPELIRWIVNFLRLKRIEYPSAASTHIPATKQKELKYLLEYFGLLEAPQAGTVLDISALTIVQPQSSVDVNRTDESVVLSSHRMELSFAACQPALPVGCSEWKVIVNRLGSGDWLFLGIIGHLAPYNSHYSYSDGTSFGWACSMQAFRQGTQLVAHQQWTNFVQGEVLVFRLKNEILSMYSLTKRRIYTLEGVSTSTPYIHFNFSSVTIKLERPTAAEVAYLD